MTARRGPGVAVLLACGLLAPAGTALGAATHLSHPSPAHHRRCAKGKRFVRLRHHRHRCVAVHKSHSATPAGPGASLLPAAPGPGLGAPNGAGGTSAQPETQVPGQAPESGSGNEPPAVPHVQVSAVEYRYTLSRSAVPAGKVVFQFVNDGQDEHNLNVDSAAGADEASFANTASKGVVNQTVVMKAGSYTLFCSLPEHEQKGMKATLTVE